MSDPATDAFTCIHAGFEAQVARTPSAIALVAPSETLTYRTLNHRANQLAHHLRSLGIGPDTLVALHLTRSAAMVVAFLAVLKAGGAYVPIDPSYPQARRAYLLNDAQAPVLLTEKGLLASLPAFAGECLCLDRDWATIAQHPTHNLPIRTTADSLAYVIYTSGSTGNPKGVLIPHRGLVNHARAMAAAFEMQPCVGAASPQPDRMLQFSSMSFDIIIEEVYPTLISGGCLILRTDAVAQSIKAFVEFVQQHQITILNLPTAFWHELVRGMETYPLPTSVRLVVVGGEKASRAMYACWRELVGERVRWLNTYGPTETTVSATLFDPLAAQFDYTHEELPIGRPLPNVTAHILNEQLEPVPLGTGGELYIGGAGLAKGYHRLPAKTAERFVDSPFDAGQQLYKTGDLVRQRPDGTIEFLGRADFQVKIRGFRIEPGEIEARLEQHPSIAQQIVVAREDTPGKKRLVAYVVPKAGRANVQEIRDFLAKSLPEYMIPSAFVVLEDLPLTTNGKVDRRSLPEPAYEIGTGAAPETELETQLVGIWQEVLSLPAVGVTDNFFELGGYSLLVARFFNQLERELGYSVPYTLLLEVPTIRELAQRLTATAQLTAPAHPLLVTLAQGENEPPLFLIHDADGDTSLYLNLAQALSRPVYGLRPRRDAQGNLVHSYLNRMAADYRQAIQTVQPAGPYLVGGLCAGGILAFEVALQLRALEQPVALVALLEAPDVEAIRFSEPSVQDRVITLWQTWQSGRTQLSHLLQKVASKSVSYLSFTLSSRLQQRSTAISTALFRYCRNHSMAIPSWLRHLSVRDLYLFSEQDYRPEPRFDGPVVLIKATVGEGVDQPYQEVYQDPLFGWQQRVTQPVQVAQVPGGHASMLSTEHVEAVASVLTQAIEKAALQEVS
ncbi:MAG: amino acid adenylation domain-containing protein [Cyanobacteria bacterium J06554_6]